ncbi:hypothetical protein N9D38_10835 [Rubripirellula sp.]|nr:hypothetical protein [Rubripirellula sp.]
MRIWGFLIALFAIFPIGCERLRTDYGESRGTNGRTSLNGFGAFRASYEKAGYQTRDMSRLSSRSKSIDAIVWLPKVHHSNSGEVISWMESWLSQGGRTLVFVVPDSGSERSYWENAGSLAAVDQRLEYRRRKMRGINQQIQWRLNRRKWIVGGWFEVLPFEHRERVESIAGPWVVSSQVSPASDEPLYETEGGDKTISINGSLDEHRDLWVEYRIQEYDAATDPTSTKQIASANLDNQSADTGPGALSSRRPSFRFETVADLSSKKISAESMVENIEGEPLVVRLSSEDWKDSQMFVVSGGSLLTNYALTDTWNCQLADRLILSGKAGRSTNPVVGFLSSDWIPIVVSDNQPNRPSKTGMEMLTQWPLSLITLHGIFLGGVVCLMLLPILGRPRKLHRETPTDFTHHLDAVGKLMKRAKGEVYARRRIEEYRRVTGAESTHTEQTSEDSG